MKNLFVPFAVAILGEAAMAVTMPSDLSLNDDFLMLAEENGADGDGTGRCAARAAELAAEHCDGNEDCVAEVAEICDVRDRCTRDVKM